MAIIFIAGFFLDWISIVLIFVPIFTPLVKTAGFDPVWFCILFLIMIQTSYLTPPMAPAIFYLRAIAPPAITHPRTCTAAWCRSSCCSSSRSPSSMVFPQLVRGCRRDAAWLRGGAMSRRLPACVDTGHRRAGRRRRRGGRRRRRHRARAPGLDVLRSSSATASAAAARSPACPARCAACTRRRDDPRGAARAGGVRLRRRVRPAARGARRPDAAAALRQDLHPRPRSARLARGRRSPAARGRRAGVLPQRHRRRTRRRRPGRRRCRVCTQAGADRAARASITIDASGDADLRGDGGLRRPSWATKAGCRTRR